MRNRVALAVGSSLLLLSSCAVDAPAPPAPGRAAAAAEVTPPPPVDSATALPPGGGCHPVGIAASGLDLFPLVNPEWAPVVAGASPESTPVLLHGTVAGSHVSREDFPSTHVTFDQNTSIDLDAADRGLLATGNAREDGALELEWETGSYPAWAWASAGDRIVAAGRWIFDCGHPDPIPGACADASAAACVLDSDCAPGVACQGTVFDYRSELHPPQAVAVIRSGGAAPLSPAEGILAGPVVPVTQADVFVSPDGGGAGDLCVATAKPDFASFLGTPPNPGCFPLSAPLALLPPDAPPLDAADFAFDVPLPARPRGSAIDFRVIPRDLPAAAADVPARLEIQPVLDPSPHLHAVVRMTEADASGRLPTGFAASILAGWRGGPRRAFAHVRVTLEGITVLDPLKAPPYPGVPVPDGWVMEASLDGTWQVIGGLDAVGAASAGSFVPLHASFDRWVPRGGTVALLASAASRSCNDTLFGQRLFDDLARFGFDTTAAFACMADRQQRDAGTVAATIPVPSLGVLPARYVAPAAGGGAAYALAFRVERLADGP
ncbi:MAG TPA: hypothetical protein VF841_21720 [Anaeromyxobacter sp.]